MALEVPRLRGKRLEPYGDKTVIGYCACGATWAGENLCHCSLCHLPGGEEAVNPWLRLSVNAESVLLDLEQVHAMHATLASWLRRVKIPGVLSPVIQ